MTYHRTLGAIDARVGEGGSGAGGPAAPPRRRVPVAITGSLPLVKPLSVAVTAPSPRRRGLPPGFEPRPVNPVAVVVAPSTVPPGFGPKPVTSSGGGGGGGGGSGNKSGRVIEIDPIDLEVTPVPAAAPAKSRLGLYLLLGAGAFVGFKLLRKRK